MTERLRVLFVEDNSADIDLIGEMLPETGPVSFRLESVSRLSEAFSRLESGDIDLVLLDLGLPDSHGLQTFRKLREAAPDIPMVVLTGNTDQETAIAAMREGAQDYFIKGEVSGSRLARAARYAVERQRAEEALRKSERQWRNTFDAINDSVCLLDSEGRIVKHNHATEAFLGRPGSEIDGRYCYDVIHGASKPIVNCPVVRIKSTKHRESLVLELKGRFLKVTVDPVLDDNRKLVGAVHIIEDITDSKQAEEALRKSKGHLTSILHSTADGILAVDKKGKVLFANSRFSELWRIPRELLERGDDKALLAYVFDQLADPVAFMTKVQELYDSGKEETSIISFKDARVFERFSSPMVEKGEIIGRIWSFRDITERKKTLRALQESEERFRISATSSSDLIWDWDVGQGKLDWFGNIDEILGYAAGEFPRTIEAWEKAIHPEDHDRVMATLEKHLKSQTPYFEEYRMMRKDGSFCYWTDCGTAMRDEKGNVYRMIGSCSDITERKRAEEALRRTEENFRRSLDESPLGVRIVTAEGETLYANRAMLDIYGFDSIEELEATPVKTRYTPESYAQFLKRKEQRDRGELDISEYDISIIRKNGEVRHLRVFRKEVLWDGEKHYQAIYLDITDRQRAEEALGESERKLKTLFEILPVGISILDTERKIVYGNPALATILDIPGEGLFRGNYARRTYLRPDGTPMPAEEFASTRAIREQRAVHDVETGVVKEDDTVIWTNVSAVPVAFPDWKVVIVTSDITERREAQEKLKETLGKLQLSLGGIIQVISRIVEMRDSYTAGHQRRVTALSKAIALEMGLAEDRVEGLVMAGEIHDLGKIFVPTEILSKPTPLTEFEFQLIRNHPRAGYDIFKKIDFPWPIAEIILQHHERIDGSGYPQGLRGAVILLEARILAVADIVEAVASDRPYRAALGIEAGLEEIEQKKGILYDPEVVKACLTLFREKGFTFQ